MLIEEEGYISNDELRTVSSEVIEKNKEAYKELAK